MDSGGPKRGFPVDYGINTTYRGASVSFFIRNFAMLEFIITVASDMKKTSLFLSLSILFYSACSTSAEQAGIPGARIENIPANVTCTTMCTDSTGFIWIGTEDSGLYHFDGTNYLHFTSDGESGCLSSSRINRVFCDSRNTLWVGTDQGVDIFDAQTGSFRRIPIRGEFKSVTTLAESTKGDVLALTEDGLFRYDATADSFKNVIQAGDTRIIKVYILPDGDIFLVGNFKIDRYDSDYHLIGSYPGVNAAVDSWKVSSEYLLLKSFPHVKLFNLENCTYEPLTGAISGMESPDRLTFVSPMGDESVIFAYDGKYYFYNFSSDALISETDSDFPFDTDVSAGSALFVRKDKGGDYWIMTRTKGLAKAKPAVNPHYFPLERYAAEHQVKSIVAGGGKVWLISDGHYLVTFDVKTQNLEVEEIGQIINRVLGEERFCDVFWDEDSDRLFLTSDSNVREYTIDSEGKRKLTHFYHPDFVSGYLKIAVDKNGGLWGGGRSGTLNYSQADNPQFSFQLSDVNLNGLMPQTRLTAITCLDNGQIAAAFHNSAIGFIDPVTRQNRVSYMTTVSDIVALCPDNEGNLWIGTASDGLWIMDLQTYEVTQSHTFSKGKISAIVRDDRGRMFLVVDNNLFQYIPSSAAWDEDSDRLFLTSDSNVREYTIDSEGKRKLTHFYHPDFVSGYLKIAVDKNGGLWGGGRSGTLNYSQADNPQFSFQLSDVNLNGLMPQTRLTAITCLDNGQIAAAFHNSAIGFIDPVTRQNRVSYMTTVSDIVALCPDNEGNLWIGTASDGLWIMDLQTYEVTQSHTFSKGKISAIVRDDRGRMFLVVDNNLFQYIPSSAAFRTILTSSGVSTVALCPVEDNQMLVYLGGELNVIERNARTSVSRIPEVAGVMTSDEKGRLLDIIDFARPGSHRIVLGKSVNNLNLTITPSELIDCSYLNCRAIFKGVFREWRDFSETSFSLDNIPYGTHRLSFMLVNPAEGTSGQTYDISIVSRRPWYISTAAKISLLFVLIGLYAFIRKLRRNNETSKRKAEMVEQEKEMQLRMNQQNIDFFTDISHEFRTPLTIISGSAETLLQDPQISSRQTHLAHLIQRNSDRMLKLVGQLMDLNKLDHGKLTLNVKACDVAGIIHNIYETFGNVAERKEITFTLDCPDYLLCWVDSDKFEKVVYNLLSNAFKYTPSGGAVSLCAKVCSGQEAGSLFAGDSRMNGNYLLVSVTDTGIGIPDDKKAEIFTRFTRINPDCRTGGTGIGLSFSKSLVETHHGLIGMRDGKAEDGSSRGSEFFFALPADNSAYSQAELSKVEPANQNTVDGSCYKSEYTIHPATAAGTVKRTQILVIDDDSEILYYLALVLSTEYEVITRSDAISGYRKIEEMHPDVIISDIMMVEMDGLKLCRMVKDDIGLSHIPFILLTAKTTTEDQIEGMNAGADAYIVKPFDPNYLKAVISSLLRNRDNVRKALGESTSIEKVEVEEEAISQQDKRLLEKLYAIMEEHLMESELNISEMTVNLGMSRTKLYYKIKGLTGQTPNEFFKTFKLNKAAEMIKEGKYKISAISDMVGFSSPSHFAAAFQKQFGKLPSKY